MKKIIFLLFASLQLSAQISATFEVDLTQYNGNYTTVEFFRGGQAYPMINVAPDVYSYTTFVPPFQATNYTYKFRVDGINESFVGNESCINITPMDTTRVINLNLNSPSLVCWQQCSPCSVPVYGCIDSTAVNFDSLANINNDSCIYNVTFFVDMSESNITYDTVELNGTFNSWCGNCAQMNDDDNDSVWEITIDLMQGDYDYKFSADNWNVEEDLYELDDCVVGSPPYINRDLIVSENLVLDTVCWNRCYSCETERNFYNVTFQLDMSNYSGNFSVPEVNGTFNNWCGNCWSLDNQGNGIYSKSFNVDTSVHTYKFSADNWSIQEELDSNLSCILLLYDSLSPNGWGFVNRYLNFSDDTILPLVCWDECFGCVQASWDCDGQGNCIDPGNGNGQYSSLSQCELICSTPTWDCDPINGCFLLNDGSGQFSDSLSCVNDCQLVSVNESYNTVDIYPNPSKGHFEINTISTVDRIIVNNKLGEQILSVKNKKSFDLSSYKSGIYFVTLTSKNKEIRTKVIKY